MNIIDYIPIVDLKLKFIKSVVLFKPIDTINGFYVCYNLYNIFYIVIRN